jgi:hypothetical protein
VGGGEFAGERPQTGAVQPYSFAAPGRARAGILPHGRSQESLVCGRIDEDSPLPGAAETHRKKRRRVIGQLDRDGSGRLSIARDIQGRLLDACQRRWNLRVDLRGRDVEQRHGDQVDGDLCPKPKGLPAGRTGGHRQIRSIDRNDATWRQRASQFGGRIHHTSRTGLRRWGQRIAQQHCDTLIGQHDQVGLAIAIHVRNLDGSRCSARIETRTWVRGPRLNEAAMAIAAQEYDLVVAGEDQVEVSVAIQIAGDRVR